MKNILMTFVGLMIASSVNAAATVTTTRIAELAAHRVERLVSLSKIDASFLKKTAKIEASAVENQAPLAFKVTVSQTTPATGTPIQLELLFDAAGKPLSFKLLAGGVAGPESGWSEKDSISLMESAMHYLEENPMDPKLAPYFEGLSSVELTKGELNGQTVAQAKVNSTKLAQKLNIYINLDGTVVTSEVVP